ncbi:MAG: zinc metallopeptidase [Bacilli bacterium]|nr:zinc metallopeptidase [Bacilli bacterium]
MDYYLISYGLMFLALIITLGAQAYVNSSYNKYKRVNNNRNITGAQAARRVLDKNGLNDIKIQEVVGFLTDHYDPTNKVIRLSSDIYNGSSVAGVAVACHECGHAIQDKEGYLMLKIRHALVPFVNISSYAGYIAIAIGVFFSFVDLIWLGILCECVILLFQLVTLPVEFDASKRALQQIEQEAILEGSEFKGGKKVLTAAALTYVASVASTLLEILRLILLFTRRRDD